MTWANKDHTGHRNTQRSRSVLDVGSTNSSRRIISILG